MNTLGKKTEQCILEKISWASAFIFTSGQTFLFGVISVGVSITTTIREFFTYAFTVYVVPFEHECVTIARIWWQLTAVWNDNVLWVPCGSPKKSKFNSPKDLALTSIAKTDNTKAKAKMNFIFPIFIFSLSTVPNQMKIGTEIGSVLNPFLYDPRSIMSLIRKRCQRAADIYIINEIIMKCIRKVLEKLNISWNE